jgi:cellulose synthase operon protein YhjQ
MKGGVGKTSIATNLACAIAKITKSEESQRVAMIDLDSQSAAQWHLGFADHTLTGICRQAIDGKAWSDIALKSSGGVICYPYGFADEPARITFEAILTHEPEWLKEQLSANAGLIAKDSVVIIDTPPGPSPYLPHAIACADIVLVVLFPDAGSYATVPAMETYLDEMIPINPSLRSVYMLNQVDESDPLGVDIFQQLQAHLGDRLAPLHVNADEAIREALAVQQPVLTYDPHGQASHDIVKLAKWLLVELEREAIKRV